ncbi:MAG: coenzyme F420-0:L-glutamate ligase, partial [Acidimicrobiales bacterium]
MTIELIAVEGIPEVRPGDDIARLITAATEVRRGDVLVVTQKIVSKAENQLVAVDPDDPLSHKAFVEEESVRVLRRRGDL